ncbi:hypothetical protein CTP45_24640 [Salmonella enterica]|uniref:Uncharacterized protein n=1 Tax=Salmonella enterica subsp. enterica serovar Saintpaul TaxID=90105 RepID=A0A5U9I5R4_SALET|nr:hypothetical protein [Salmonella enterica]EBS2301371.1 hypothetical protein [Salmonella enterica subsp. enterica serovar Saintpaul]EDW0017504.1 hypothetical protein [Salmonella enterica subsp. enterica serovar Aba]HCZ4727704.1 hypothetical protein [Salmonella enterica subsp. enterica serovar Saintpaul str. CFSAN004137]EAW8023127.1 hypothetical protein [Salmonella enterica]
MSVIWIGLALVLFVLLADVFTALIGFVLSVSVLFFGAYGLLTDISHNHWGFTALDILSSGVIAVIRGGMFFFGLIAY